MMNILNTTIIKLFAATASLLLLTGGGVEVHALSLPSLSTTSTTTLAILPTLLSFNLGTVEALFNYCPDQCTKDNKICGAGTEGTYNGGCCRKLGNKYCVLLSNALQEGL